MQGRLIDFNVIEYKKSIDVISYSTLQLPLKKILLIELWCNTKENYPQLSERLLKVLFSFPTT